MIEYEVFIIDKDQKISIGIFKSDYEAERQARIYKNRKDNDNIKVWIEPVGEKDWRENN